ncbi:AEC family transporter [Lucifera butyrica]|nr:AEC family transporter [Lucifera butyrica]
MESILSIIIMVSIGYILTAHKWFDEQSGRLFARLVSYIALPAYMLWNLMSSFNHDKLVELSSGLLVPFASIALCYAIGYTVSRAIKIEPKHQGTFRSMFFSSNSVFIGLPINLALFGPESLPYVLLYYIANTTTFWTIGLHGIRADGTGGGKSLLSLDTLRQILSPPLLGFLCAILFILLRIHLPPFITDTSKYLGSMTTPLSMLFIGIALFQVKFKEIRFNKDMIAILLGRFVVSPLAVLGVAALFPIPLLMKNVFVIQAAMPVMTQTSIMCRQYKSDYRYAAVMTLVTTLLTILVVPLYMTILQHLPG